MKGEGEGKRPHSGSGIFLDFLLSVLLLAVAGAAGSAGTADAEKLSFLVLGDWGKQGGREQRRVAAGMASLAADKQVDFIVTTGDNFYPEGVDSVDDPLWLTTYEDIYSAPSLRELPWYASLGNHDYMGDVRAQVDYGQKSTRWRLPGRFYSRTFGSDGVLSAELFFIDTSALIDYYRSRPDKYRRITDKKPAVQLNWLRTGLARSSAKWKIVIGHHPVYSSGWRHGDTEELKDVLPPIFLRFGVHAYFAGHDHHLEHRPAEETQYFISGGGAESRWVWLSTRPRFATASTGFAHVVLSREAMRVAFINGKGERLYAVEIPAKSKE